ncbi:MAG: hypothetical protein J6K61_05155 [Clostridia bacterium]|nr:hypothetical protein [Clostridia bacterium]
MKKSIKLVALTMALVVFMLALVSCSTYGSIKKNFEKNGYTLQNAENEPTETIELDEGEITYTIHTFQKEGSGIIGSIMQGVSTAVVWEFSSSKDLQKAMAEDEDIKAFLQDADESEYVNGNCILMTINPDAVKIFNGEDLD